MTAKADREEGFTLIEMLVVLSLFALVASATAFAMTGGRDAREVAGMADRLAAELQRTRIDAIRSGRSRALFFDAGTKSWRREGEPPVALGDALVLDLTTAREAGALRGASGSAAIAFMPDGRSTGGRIELRMGTARRVLEVNWLTGAVRRGAL